MSQATPPEPLDRIEAAPTRDAATRKFILAAMLLGFGGWCAFDMGKYPYVSMNENINQFLTWAFNHIGAAAFPLAALIPLVLGVKQLRRKLVADATGVGFAGQDLIAWGDIRELDASELAAKGYLHVYYGDGQKLTLDSYQFANFRDVAAFMERHIPADRIKR